MAAMVAANRSISMMDLKDAERWKDLERRARVRGWTIDTLQLGTAESTAPAGGTRGAFALVELNGDERHLATCDLDAIEAHLKSNAL